MSESKPKKSHYLSNSQILPEFYASKERGEMTDKFARQLLMLTAKYAVKGQFGAYSYNQDMQGYALQQLVKTWHKFDPERTNNAFAYYTQCIKNSFIQYLKYEKKTRRARDAVMMQQGLNPSYNYQDEYGTDLFADDEQDFDKMNIPTLSSSTSDAPIIRDDRGDEVTPSDSDIEDMYVSDDMDDATDD